VRGDGGVACAANRPHAAAELAYVELGRAHESSACPARHASLLLLQRRFCETFARSVSTRIALCRAARKRHDAMVRKYKRRKPPRAKKRGARERRVPPHHLRKVPRCAGDAATAYAFYAIRSFACQNENAARAVRVAVCRARRARVQRRVACWRGGIFQMPPA